MKRGNFFNELMKIDDERLGELQSGLEKVNQMMSRDDEDIDLCSLMITTEKLTSSLDKIAGSLINEYIQAKCQTLETLAVGGVKYPIVDGLINIPGKGKSYFASAVRELTGIDRVYETFVAIKLLDVGKLTNAGVDIEVY